MDKTLPIMMMIFCFSVMGIVLWHATFCRAFIDITPCALESFQNFTSILETYQYSVSNVYDKNVYCKIEISRDNHLPCINEQLQTALRAQYPTLTIKIY